MPGLAAAFAIRQVISCNTFYYSPLQVEFQDLEMHRIIGTGQFGLVRIVRHMKTNEVYALKVGTLELKTWLHHIDKCFRVLSIGLGSQLGSARWLWPQALRPLPAWLC